MIKGNGFCVQRIKHSIRLLIMTETLELLCVSFKNKFEFVLIFI